MMHTRPNLPRASIEPTTRQWLAIKLISRQHCQANFAPKIKPPGNP